MDHDSNVLKLKALLGDYPNTLALKKGEVRSPNIIFDFADVKAPSTAFKDVVRHLKYDVAELAIVTYLQAKAHGKPLALLPAVVVGTLPHPFLAYNAERGQLTPADLKGRRVGIRAYSVTTAAWIRGILQNDHGVDLDSIKWVTFEDPHVAEYHDPATAERAPAGKQLAQMLFDGEIDAGLVGGPDLKDPRLQPVIPNPRRSGAGMVPTQRNAADQSYGRGQRIAVKDEPIGGERDLSLVAREQAGRTCIKRARPHSVRRGKCPAQFGVDHRVLCAAEVDSEKV